MLGRADQLDTGYYSFIVSGDTQRVRGLLLGELYELGVSGVGYSFTLTNALDTERLYTMYGG